MLILNSGGTFNKKYNPLNGELEIPFDNSVIETILESYNAEYSLSGVVYKDSIDMDLSDRKMLTNIILESKDHLFIIIHGTDTMDKTAEFLDTVFDDRIIVLVGAMKPFEIDTIEASLNLGIAMGFAKATHNYGVYICMNGHVELWNNIKKNEVLGKFEVVK